MKRRRDPLWIMLFAVLALSPGAVVAEASSGQSENQPQAARSIPYKQENAVDGEFFGNAVMALVVLLAAAAGTLFLARRYMPSVTGGVQADNAIEVIQIRRLTPKLHLFLVRVRGREVLLAQHGDSLVVLGEGYERRPASGAATEG